jgi:hypothetical protein
VASSYNFYPFGNIRREDGVAHVAVGLGKSVVEGYEALRFCPRYPEIVPQFSSVKDTLRNAQRRFYALDMARDDMIAAMPPDANLLHREVGEAVEQGAANMVASSYVRADDAITGGIVRGGSPVITFAPLLKDRAFPLPQILCQVLDLAQEAMECPVEIEFALDFNDRQKGSPTFYLLQVRPIMVEQASIDVVVDSDAPGAAVVYSEDALGHGRRTSVSDLVVIDSGRFDRAKTQQTATIIERLNRALYQEGRNYVLIGPGRWGSQDSWYGIPVAWPQISAARAIVETDFGDAEVEPSHGSHFFHNITAFGIAYLTVHQSRGEGRVNWDWLKQQPSLQQELDGVIRHIRLETPVQVLVDGNTGRGIILCEEN